MPELVLEHATGAFRREQEVLARVKSRGRQYFWVYTRVLLKHVRVG